MKTFLHSSFYLYLALFLQLLHRQLAVQSLGIVIDLEGKDFDRHSVFLPFLSESFSQDLSSITKRGKEDKEEEMEVEEIEDDDKMEETGNELQVDITSIDHYLFSVLVTLEKIISNCGTDYTDHSIHSQMRNIWGKYTHTPVTTCRVD